MKKSQKFIAIILWLIVGFIIISPLLNSCRTSSGVTIDTIYVIKQDTISVIDYKLQDSLVDVLRLTRDSLKRYRDSIEYEDYINARRIEKVKYYINICEKNSKQKKYFYGWIKRAVSE